MMPSKRDLLKTALDGAGVLPLKGSVSDRVHNHLVTVLPAPRNRSLNDLLRLSAIAGTTVGGILLNKKALQ